MSNLSFRTIFSLNKSVLAILVIFGITLLYFGPTLIPPTGKMLLAGDVKHIYLPYREFLRTSIFQGEIPFWNPYLFSGIPFIAHPYTQFFYPTTILGIFLPTNLYLSFVLALHVFLGSLFMYLLLRQFTNPLSSLLGAIVYGFNGYMSSRIYAGHLDYIISNALFPGIFLAYLRYVHYKNVKWLAIGTVLLAFQIFTGLLTVTFFVGLTCALFSFATYVRNPSLLYASVKRGFLFFFLGLSLSAIYLIPSYEFISLTIRGRGLPYEQAAWGSAAWQTFLLFFNPTLLGSDFQPNNPFKGPAPDYVGHIYFVGVTALVVIAFGLYHRIFLVFIRKKYDEKVDPAIAGFLLIGLISILIALGPNSYVNLHYILWRFLELYKSTRLPVRHLIMTVFALSGLVGIVSGTIQSEKLKILLIFIAAFELIAFSRPFITLTNTPSLLPTNDAALNSFIQKNELVRVLPDFTLASGVREEISFASPLTHRYFSTSGYTPAILSSYYDFLDRVNGNATSSIATFNSEVIPSNPTLPAVKFLNVKYIITDVSADPLEDKKDTYSLTSETKHYRIYESKNYLERFFFAANVKSYPDRQSLQNNLLTDQDRFHDTVIVLESQVPSIKYKPDCANETKAGIRTTDYRLNTIRLETETQCNGFLSSGEVYYPGWKAEIDGKPEDILVANGGFRALNIPKGKHTIVFWYDPTVYVYSAAVCLLSAIALLYLFLKYRSHAVNRYSNP